MTINLKGWRTYLVAGISALVAIASFILTLSTNLPTLTGQESGTVIVMAVLMALLRTITTTSPTKGV